MEHSIDIVSTYMVLMLFHRNIKEIIKIIEFMCQDVMPYVIENGLAEFLDVFCEEENISVENQSILCKKLKI